MARGWESKSVEEQQSEAAQTHAQSGPRLTPDQVTIFRQREGLLLSRKHVLEQLQEAQDPRHQEILRRALADLDSKLAAICLP
jgi:hypothetical protein